MNTANQLPAGFESLEPFVAQWAKETSQERIIARSEAPFEDIKRFYDAMVDKAEEALALVNEYPLDDIPNDVARLGRLSTSWPRARRKPRWTSSRSDRARAPRAASADAVTCASSPAGGWSSRSFTSTRRR